MINLLPTENQKHLQASQLNTTLLKYVFFFLAILLALTASIGFIYLNLIYTKISLEHNLEDARAQTQSIAKTKQQATELQTQIKDVANVFNQQVHYSKLFTALAEKLPSNVRISSFHVGDTAFIRPQIIQIHAPTSDDVIKAKRALKQAKFIDSVSIASVVTDQKSGTVTGTLSVTFDKKGLGETLQWHKK